MERKQRLAFQNKGNTPAERTQTGDRNGEPALVRGSLHLCKYLWLLRQGVEERNMRVDVVNQWRKMLPAKTVKVLLRGWVKLESEDVGQAVQSGICQPAMVPASVALAVETVVTALAILGKADWTSAARAQMGTSLIS